MPAPADGVLSRLDAYAVGVAAWRLGAGRARKEDPVQAGAGVEMHAKPGAGCAAASRCSRCTPTSRTGSPGAEEALGGRGRHRARGLAAGPARPGARPGGLDGAAS